MIGQTISHYRIIAKIGKGGMGEVYLAEDTKLKRQVALKFLSPQSLDTPEAKTRFVHEARAAASLEHPNICAVHEIDEIDGHTFIAMAYVDGQSLKDKIETGPLSLDEALNLAIDIAKGLQEAHEKNIVHRDIKSANVMISRKGQGKITDFGLAKLDGGTRVTKTGTMLGTAAYMSPEQVSAETVDRRSDIWSLGVILHEMLTGRLPFVGDQAQAVAYQIIHEDAEPITAIRTGVPMELERIVRKCLSKDPSNRYQHVDDLLVDLRNVDKAPFVGKTGKNLFRYALPASVAILAIVLFAVLSPLKSPETSPVFENPLAGATFTKITDFEASQGAISPDGKFIAFVSDRDGEYDVWVSQVGTGNVYNRTKGQLGDVRAAGLRSVGFAGDGSELWLSGRPGRGMQIMPLLDGPVRGVFTELAGSAAWTRDGRRAVYRTMDAGDPLFVADGDGTNSRGILSSDSGMHQHYPIWSPDEQWIYVTRGWESYGGIDLWRVRPDGQDLEQLTFDQRGVAYPAPIDESTVLYVASNNEGAGPWLWAVDVETKRSQRVSIGLEEYRTVSTSADGRRLVATIAHPEANLWSVPILDRIAKESDAQPYSLPAVRALAPRFAGGELFFLSSRGTGDGLWRYHDGQLTEIWNGSEGALLEAPSVSPNGKSVAIVLRSDSGGQLHLMNSDGSNLRAVAGGIKVRGASSWSPDEEHIVVGGEDTTGWGLFVIPSTGGLPARIADGDALNPVWSPRGDLIVYAGKQVGAYSPVLAVQPDGRSAEFPDIPEVFVRGERFRFLPDGGGLVYMRGALGAMDFWLIDLSTMKHRRLTELAPDAEMRTFDITPDGKTIVFDRQRDNSEIVLIELANDRTNE